MIEYENIIKNWIKNYVIKFDWCPFAHESISDDQIEFITLNNINENNYKKTVNTFLTLTNKTQMILFIEDLFIQSFEQMNDLNDDLDYLNKKNKFDLLSISFHPRFQFAHHQFDDRINFVNRSPLPFFHIFKRDTFSHLTKNINGKDISIKNEKEINLIPDKKWEEMIKGLDEMTSRHKK